MLGMPSSPGALYGLKRAMCLRVCSFVIGSMSHAGGRKLHSLSLTFTCWGFFGKKVFASEVLLSALVLAMCSPAADWIIRLGILDFPPLLAGAEMYLCAVHMSGSVAFSSQSRQWVA